MHALGIDFGTSNTVAALSGPDGRVRPLVVDGSPLVPSAVFAAGEGEPLVGVDAVRAAPGDPRPTIGRGGCCGTTRGRRRSSSPGTVWPR